jgi:hypothetical protein
MGKENPRLDAMTTSIKLINPKAFLTDADLPNRRFYHKPNLNIPFLSFIEEKV